MKLAENFPGKLVVGMELRDKVTGGVPSGGCLLVLVPFGVGRHSCYERCLHSVSITEMNWMRWSKACSTRTLDP